MLNTIIERLTEELDRPAVYRESDQTLHLPADLVRDIVTSLVWAGDEIAQLREDLSGSMGAVCQMTDEMAQMEAEIIDLQEVVADYSRDAELADHRIDVYLGV